MCDEESKWEMSTSMLCYKETQTTQYSEPLVIYFINQIYS